MLTYSNEILTHKHTIPILDLRQLKYDDNVTNRFTVVCYVIEHVWPIVKESALNLMRSTHKENIVVTTIKQHT